MTFGLSLTGAAFLTAGFTGMFAKACECQPFLQSFLNRATWDARLPPLSSRGCWFYNVGTFSSGSMR